MLIMRSISLDVDDVRKPHQEEVQITDTYLGISDCGGEVTAVKYGPFEVRWI